MNFSPKNTMWTREGEVSKIQDRTVEIMWRTDT